MWKPGDDVTDEMLDDLWNYAMVEGQHIVALFLFRIIF